MWPQKKKKKIQLLGHLQGTKENKFPPPGTFAKLAKSLTNQQFDETGIIALLKNKRNQIQKVLITCIQLVSEKVEIQQKKAQLEN